MKLPFLSISKFGDYLLIAFLASLAFPIRYVFDSSNAYLTGAYSDFTSFSLYSCDFLLIGLVIYCFFCCANKRLPGRTIILLLLWQIVSVFSKETPIFGLNIFFFSKIAQLYVLHETITQGRWNLRQILPKTLVFIGFLQSGIALLQFLYQKSLGLYWIGEQHFDPGTLGIAKIGLDIGKFVRSYGTFPHPNLLSAFLFVCIVFNIYLLNKARESKFRILYSIMLIFNIFGLFTTFSRAGLLAFVLGTTFSLVFSYFLSENKKTLLLATAVLILSTLSAFMVFKPFIMVRTNLADDQSTKERVFYNQIGLKMIKDHPIVGTGPGESVLHMERFSGTKLQPWEIQPIHNYFLLTAAEVGIPGLIIFFSLLIAYLAHLIKSAWLTYSKFQVSLLAILLGFIILMTFDHYFYTIEQTQLLLWLILGVVAHETKNLRNAQVIGDS